MNLLETSSLKSRNKNICRKFYLLYFTSRKNRWGQFDQGGQKVCGKFEANMRLIQQK